MAKYGEYTVEGYGERKDYDQPYAKEADFDPQFVFAHAGNPEAQEQYQNDLIALDEAKSVSKDVSFFDLDEDNDE